MSERGPEFPTHDEVAEKLRQLITGAIERNEAARWAAQWIMRFDEFDNIDTSLVNAIDKLSAADMISLDRPFLYSKSDFEQWLISLTGGH